MNLLELRDSVNWLLAQAKLQHITPETIEVDIAIVHWPETHQVTKEGNL